MSGRKWCENGYLSQGPAPHDEVWSILRGVLTEGETLFDDAGAEIGTVTTTSHLSGESALGFVKISAMSPDVQLVNADGTGVTVVDADKESGSYKEL